MLNPIAWTFSQIRNMVWRYQFNRTPTKVHGNLLVKEFRGSLYCVDVIETKSCLRLRYVQGSKETGWANFGIDYDGRMWEVVEPLFPEYANLSDGIPTLAHESLIQFLTQKGFIASKGVK